MKVKFERLLLATMLMLLGVFLLLAVGDYANAAPFESTTKGRIQLSCDGTKVSEHVVETEATARAILYALEHGGKARCDLDPPSKVIEIDIPAAAAPAPTPTPQPSPLAAPSSITATPVSPTSITVAWSAVPGAQSYAVERCTGAACTELTPLVCTIALTVNHAIAPQVTGKYRVRASRAPDCAGDYSPYTTIAQAKTPAAPEPAPAPPIGSVTITWTQPISNTDGSVLTDLASYRIHYGTTDGTLANVVQVSHPGASRHTLTGLEPGGWFFAVTACNLAGACSAPSNVAMKQVL